MTWADNYQLSLLAYIGSFIGTLLIYEGLRQVLSRSETAGQAKNRRMRLIAKGATTAELLELLKPQPRAWAFHKVPLIGRLQSDLRQAGKTISPGAFVALCLAATCAMAVAVSLILPPVTAVALAIATGLLVPIAVVRGIRAKRMTLLMRQLPDALDLMSRGLRVGHPLNTTVAAVARDMADPVAMEFGLITDQVSYGDDLIGAFADFADRVETEDARYLAVAVAIQHGTGGDLASVLSTLARVIRDRITMRKRVKAISAEGRLSAWFLSFIPVAILVSMSVITPGYYGDISGDPAFRPAAAVVLGLIAANALALRALVNFRF